MSTRFRNVVVVAVVIVAMGLITLQVNGAHNAAQKATSAAKDANATVGELSTVLAKRSPVTEFDAAVALHNDCRKDIEDQFFASVGNALSPDADQAAKVEAARNANAAGAKLDMIDQLCPEPRPAVFNDDGSVLVPPLIPEQYQCSIDRRPCPPGS